MSKRSCEYCKYLTTYGAHCRLMDRPITSSTLFERGCQHFEELKQTVFDYITESVEALAEKLVYQRNCKMIHQDDKCTLEYWTYSWKSSVIPGQSFETKEEAIAATVEELKKEWK